jgi:general secretion pathway protein J
MIGRRPRGDAGFTLLEILIAVAVMALIGGITYKAFDSAYDLKTRIERGAERDQTMRAALTRMAREVSMAYLSEHYDKKRYRERPTRFRLKGRHGDDDLLFTSFAHERLQVDAKESDEAVFEYQLGRDPDNGLTNLYRRVKPIIDEEYERGGERSVLAEDVIKFEVGVWDPRDREWRNEWDSGSTERNGQVLIPPRVKLSLTIRDEYGKEKAFSTQAKIFLGQPLDF